MAQDTSAAAADGVRRRRSRVVLDAALTVVVVGWLATLAVVVVRRGDRDADVTAVAPASAEVQPRTEPATAGEIVDQLEIEAGFTPGEVVACDTAGGRATGFYPDAERCAPEDRAVIGETVAYAIVVENPGDHVVRNVWLTYRFVDESGAVVREPATVFDDGVLDAEEASIPVIRAGERFAVSSTLYLESNHVAEIEVEINEVGEWLGADYYEHTGQARFDAGDLGLDATGVEVGYGPLNEPIVTFSVDHSGDEPIDLSALYAYVVFRDADGAILGGTFGDVGDPGPARRGSVRVPAGGSIDGEVAVDDPMEIPGIDPSRTEVHLKLCPLTAGSNLRRRDRPGGACSPRSGASERGSWALCWHCSPSRP